MSYVKFKLFLAATAVGMIYTAWMLSRPVEVIAVHHGQYISQLLVKNLPVTGKGKIEWWEENKSMLKEKYGIPKPFDYGMYSVTVWDFGKGYQIEAPDENTFFPSDDTSYLLCFDDMKTKENCINKKNWRMDINKTRGGDIRIRVKGASYRQLNNGDFIKERED